MIDLKRVQCRLLDIAIEIKKILEKRKINYLITYGTLLGAVRHKGFIPWDDDFDLFILDDEYDRAIHFLKKELPDNLFLENETVEPNFFHGWSRVKDKNTRVKYSFYEKDNIYKNKGLSIDLFRLKEVNELDLKDYRFKENLKYIDRIKKLKIIDEFDYIDRYNHLIDSLRKSNDNFISNKKVLTMLLCGEKIEIEDVFPLRNYEFEGVMFYGPNNAHKVLTHFYGDYMKIPPDNQRKIHYESVVFLN